jgi:hypothetical protein
VIESGELAATYPAPAGDSAQSHALRLPPDGHAGARVELRDETGAAFALSNPIHFLRELPAEGLPAPTAAIDRDGMRSTLVRGLRLMSFERANEDVRIGLDARGGELDLELADAPRAVSLEGLSGSAELKGTTVWARDLDGAGVLVLVRQ